MTDTNIKVLVITSSISKNIGGLATLSHSVVEQFPALGVDYHVVSDQKHGAEERQSNILLAPNSWAHLLRNCMAVRRYARSYDVVHAFDGWPYGVYGLFATLGTRKKLFISGIGTYSVAPLASRWQGFLLKLAYRKSRAVFCISDYTRKKILEKVSLKNTQVVLLGPKSLPMINEETVQRYQQEYQLGDRRPIFLTVGDIKARKGQLDTLKALALIKERYPHFLYIIIGSISSQEYYQQIYDFASAHGLKDNIMFPPDVTTDEKIAFFYTVCDVFMLNSNNYKDSFEGFGLVFLEAAQFAKPVIGSRDCGIESALRDGYNGYLANQGDAADIAKKIELILGQHYRQLAEHSRLFAGEFSWQRTAAAYVREYQR